MRSLAVRKRRIGADARPDREADPTAALRLGRQPPVQVESPDLAGRAGAARRERSRVKNGSCPNIDITDSISAFVRWCPAFCRTFTVRSPSSIMFMMSGRVSVAKQLGSSVVTVAHQNCFSGVDSITQSRPSSVTGKVAQKQYIIVCRY